jgi:predicted dehydrogenase
MRRLRMGQVGGGPGSFIGRIHRMAAGLDGEIELVCGAFSSDPEQSKIAGASLYLDPQRIYASYAEMIETEKELPADRRMDFVSIVTPNHVHCAPTQMALENGFHVVVDKPLTVSLTEAKSLRKTVEKTGRVLAVTHTYSGYPLVKEARAIVSSGKIGAIRKVYVEYPQGWLSTALEKSGQKQASWRTDPAQSGAGGAIGDIGTHAAHLAEYITGLKITAINALLNTFVKGRRLDDDSSMLVKFDNGASGVLFATQVAAGEENNLSIRVYGELGGLEWRQEEPNTLVLKWLDRPKEILRAGWNYLSEAAKSNTRTPAGHPEGYVEAFANIYLAFARAVRDHELGKRIDPQKYDFPSVEEGVRGMTFIDAVIKSAHSTQKWTPIL